MGGTRGSVLVGLVVLVAILAGVAIPSPSAATETGDADPERAADSIQRPGPAQSVGTVVIAQEFGAIPDRAGHVRVTQRFEIPDGVESLRTTLPGRASVTGTDGGFSRVADRRYEWTGGSREPSISYALAVNETGQVSGPEAADGRFLFVDVGEWGLFRRPNASVEVTTRSDVRFDWRATVDGPGVAGDRLVYVGDHEETRRSAHGQTFRLVEPAAADLVESREEIFASVTDAAGSLRVGGRDDEVLMVAAPTSVDWAVEGLQTGESDVYVTADERVDDPNNVWLHEYVHTRQDFELTDETRWVGEATATYYAALLTLEQDRIDYAEFREVVGIGARHPFDSAVLAEPGTWVRGANYRKGTLVVGDLDRRLRTDPDSGGDLQAVFRRLNERRDAVDAAGFVSLVRAVGTDDVAATTDRYTTTEAAPDAWDRSTHQATFGPLPARLSVSLPDVEDGTYRVEGAYRARSLAGVPIVLVPDETLSIDVRIENVGGRSGSYNLSYGLADGPLRYRAGSVDAGETVTETVDVRVDRAGDGPVRVGDHEVPVSVVEPATPEVDALNANRSRVRPGEAVGLEIDLRNPADRPGSRAVTVTRDGRAVATETVRLDADESTTVFVPVRLVEAGTHRLAVGNRSVTVRASDGGIVGEIGPGVGAVGALVAICLVVALALAIRRR